MIEDSRIGLLLLVSRIAMAWVVGPRSGYACIVVVEPKWLYYYVLD